MSMPFAHLSQRTALALASGLALALLLTFTYIVVQASQAAASRYLQPPTPAKAVAKREKSTPRR